MQLALVLATLGTPVLEPNLNPGLAQTESLAKFLPHERVGIMSLVEQSFQLGQLFQSEIRSGSSLFPVPVTAVPAIRPWKKRMLDDRGKEIFEDQSIGDNFSKFVLFLSPAIFMRMFKSRERSRGNCKFNHRIIVHGSFLRPAIST